MPGHAPARPEPLQKPARPKFNRIGSESAESVRAREDREYEGTLTRWRKENDLRAGNWNARVRDLQDRSNVFLALREALTAQVNALLNQGGSPVDAAAISNGHNIVRTGTRVENQKLGRINYAIQSGALQLPRGFRPA